MPTFLVTFNNNEVKELEAASRADLLQSHFSGDESQMKSQVKLIRWHHNTVAFTENVATGEIDKIVSTADANPYGWREKGGNSQNPNKDPLV